MSYVPYVYYTKITLGSQDSAHLLSVNSPKTVSPDNSCLHTYTSHEVYAQSTDTKIKS